MKRCPQCGREYDISMSFCLDDGAELLYGPGFADEAATAILSGGGSTSESRTRAQIHTTEKAAVRPNGVADAPEAKRFDKRLLLAPVALAVIVLGGSLGYRYFSTDSSGTIRSIAVLPFENRSNDPEADYLSDGLAESLIYRLSQLPDLKVSPTSSVMQYKGKGGSLAEIANDLGVRAVMTGKLVQRGDSLTISIELIDVPNNKLLWGEQYERKMEDLLSTQREIAATITQKLQLKLVGNEKGVAKKYTDSNEAYQLYLKGRYHFGRRTKDDMFRSVELLKQATELDPNFALAYVGIAESYTSMPSYPYISPNEASPRAREAIARALQLDPELPEAHAIAGMIATTDERDYVKAEREFKRAIELDPNLAITHYRYGWTYLSSLGRHEEAIAEMKRAMELEPLALQQGANYAAVLMYARRFDEAVEQARKTYQLDPNHLGAQSWLCHTLSAKGLYSEAISVAQKMSADHAYTVTSIFGCMGLAYAKTGQREKALERIAAVKQTGKSTYVATYWIAVIYAGLGDKDAAFAELEESFQNRDWFLQKLKVDPFMDPLRDDPRFDAMVKRLNLPE